jgi:amino acid adenylation domain-containing protein
MVPQHFMRLEAIPLTPNGKVDRKALPAPDVGASGAAEYQAPRNATETSLVSLWEEVLGVAPIGINDNFFERGGHSLLAARVSARLGGLFGVSLPLRAFFEAPVLWEFAARIDAAGNDAATESAVGVSHSGIDIVPRDGELPLSHAQVRLWFLDQLESGSAAYVMPSATLLRGDLNFTALQRTLGEIVRRHEILRSVFVARDGTPHLRIQEPAEVTATLTDLSDRLPEDRAAEAQRLTAVNANQPFDLSTGPLYRAHVLRLSDTEHVLLMAFHHIVFDFWSASVFGEELAALYGAFAADERSPLADPEYQFVDFVAWQNHRLDDGLRDRLLEYWVPKLGTDIAPLELPADRRRDTAGPVRGARCSRTLSSRTTEALRALSRQRGVTTSTTLLALFDLLMHRMTGSSTIVVGSPVAGRNLLEVEKLIGFFINTVAIRADFTSRTLFSELLQQVQDASLEAYEHQEMPFEELVRAIEPERDLSRTPLFQVFFNHVAMEPPAIDVEGLHMEPYGDAVLESKFDLTLYAFEHSNSLDIVFSYNASLFDEFRMEVLIEQYAYLAEQVLAQPGLAAADYSLVTQPAVLPRPTEELLPQTPAAALTCRQLAKYGNRSALVSSHGDWSYALLDGRADLLAARLVSSGLRKGEIVAIYAQREPSLVCAMLGVLRAGGAFALFDPAYPDARLAECWRLVQPRAAIVARNAGRPGQELEDCLTSDRLRATLELGESLFARLADDTAQDALPEPGPDDLAYVAFTSGTTGGIKAVLGNHGPVAHFLEWQKATFELGASDRFSMLSGISHDPFLRDVFAPLWCGGSLHIPDAEAIGEPAEVAKFVTSQQINVAHLTPAMAQLMSSALAPESATSLKLVFLSGDILRASTVSQLRHMAPGVECVNFYGATETPQAMSYHRVAQHEGEIREELPLGRGIDGVQLLVVNENGNLAGPGELGEIVIRTPFLARGYLGDQPLTTRQFAINPFTRAEGDRVYRSGDLGRYLPNGEVEFAGRRDGQVKIRGFRIELGEVEAILRGHSGVGDAAAAVRETPSGDKRLIAYVVASGDSDARDLQEYLRTRLPAYAVPGTIATLEKIPLTPNGKVDRKALPDAVPGATSAEFEAPQTAHESSVAEIFRDILEVGKVGRLDNFFDLGGHSLLGARVIARVRSELGVELPLRKLFESPTVAQIGAELAQLSAAGEEERRPQLIAREHTGPVPISFAQERMWYLQQMMPDTGAFNLVGALDLSGELNTFALQKAFSTIVERHESLHTLIHNIDGAPFQKLADPGAFELNRVDLAGLADEAQLRDALTEEGARPFDLERGPLLRITLYTLGERHHVLQIVCHHIVSDAWSMGVFVRELGKLYHQYASGVSAELPELPVQYRDYSLWQRDWLVAEELERQLEYWRAELDGAPPNIELPADRPRPPEFSHRGARHTFRIPAALRDRVTALSRREGATLFMTLLSVFQVLLLRYSGQADVVVGTPVANRMHSSLENLIGFFVNTVVLRGNTAEAGNFHELLENVRNTSIGAFSHQELPFERLVEDLQPKRDLSRNPVFQIMFVLQNMELTSLSLEDLQIEPYPLERNTAQVDLTLFLLESGDGIDAIFEYATDLFDAQTIERMAGHYVTLVDEFTAAPQTDLLSVPLMDVEERRRVVNDFNDTAMAYPRDDTALTLFAEQVSRRPQAIALQSCGESLSYEDLDRQSNRLAHHLRSLGVATESLVGLCLDRGLDMVVAALGILKAGAGYVPLDPGFPSERLHYMLEDCGAAVVVTNSPLAEALLAGSEQRLVRLDADAAAIGTASTQALPPSAAANNRAYVIYTSGSTGKPKGVEIEHRALTNFLTTMAQEPGLAEDDVLYAVTTLSFDISILELFLPLTVGAMVEIAHRDAASDSARLQRDLEACGATVMQATPSTWRILIESGWKGTADFKALCGGEAFPADLLPELTARAGEVWNMYGPTETTIWSSCAKLAAGQPIHIGAPIGNTCIYILNERLQPQPVGVPGELYIGGDGVARGYLNRPGLTAERFVADPFADDSAARIYRSGDKARWRPDGTIEHLGRLDDQVKVRGYRIELGEIEACLASHPVVAHCAVALSESRPDDQRLMAYFVPEDGQSTTVTELRTHLKSELPAYMIPQHFVEVDSLPLTPNGKIDRRALGALSAPVDSGQTYVAPNTAAERRLAQIWSEMLGIDRVGLHDNFFDIGGHSLLAIRLRARMFEVTGVDVTLQSLTSDTLGQIAAAFDAEIQQDTSRSAVGDDTHRGASPFVAIRSFLGRVWRR